MKEAIMHTAAHQPDKASFDRTGSIGRIAWRWKMFTAAVVFPAIAAIAGCQSAQQSAAPLPPPISAVQQISQLNRRALRLATLRLVGSLKLDYTDRLGNRHEFQTHFVMMVDQQARQEGTGPVSLLLSGTYLGENVFEMGINNRMYWLVNRRNKIAYVGHPGRSDPHARAIPIDPRQVLQMLAVGELRQTAAQSVVMTGFPRDRYNRLFVVERLPNGSRFVQRELVVDRLTGNVAQVAMFNADGISEARSSLSDYRPLEPRDGTQPVMVPMHIDLVYPAGKAELHLVVSKATLQLKVPAKYAFASPDFSGLRIVAVRSVLNSVDSP